MSKVISPFLTVYKPQLTSMMSIMGRATGIILSIVVYVWLMLLKLKVILMSDYIFYIIMYFIFKHETFGILISGIILFILLVFYYHLVFAVRNIVWFYKEDLIKMDIESIYKGGYLIIGISSLLAIINWLYLLY